MINDKLGNICNTFNGNYFLNKKNFYKSLRKNIKLNEKKKNKLRTYSGNLQKDRRHIKNTLPHSYLGKSIHIRKSF